MISSAVPGCNSVPGDPAGRQTPEGALSVNSKEHSAETRRVKHELLRLLDEEVLSLDFLSAVAGDRDLSPEERTKMDDMKKRRGNKFYSDLLFSLTHQYFPREISQKLWYDIVQHKDTLSEAVGRNVGVAVAALDYLSNVKEQLEAPKLISEPKAAAIAEVALKNGLTHLYDYTSFYSKLQTEIKRYQRYGSDVSLIMIDIDDFKEFNDTRGHQQGDRILTRIAESILETTRDLDICARYGGEEFAVILPQTGSREAASIAERLRRRVPQACGNEAPVTISLGVASCPEHADSARALVKKADTALYQSKSKGKNRVTVCSDDDE